jgi:hypothetical protein
VRGASFAFVVRVLLTSARPAINAYENPLNLSCKRHRTAGVVFATSRRRRAADVRTCSQVALGRHSSKRADAPYRSERNENWLKIKAVHKGKFPVVGFVKDPSGVAALYLGKH